MIRQPLPSNTSALAAHQTRTNPLSTFLITMVAVITPTASHMTTVYRGGSGYVVSSSPTKNISLSPSVVQGSGGSGRVSPSPSFVTSYKPGPSLSTKFVDRDCSLSESSFTESCTNFNHKSTTLQSNV